LEVIPIFEDADVSFDENGTAYITTTDRQIRLHPKVVNVLLQKKSEAIARRIFRDVNDVQDVSKGALCITDKDLMD